MSILKLATSAQRTTQTKVDTIQITKEIVGGWANPNFQRPLKINEKVRNLAAEVKANGGVLPGIITLGVVGKMTYLLDGQHRREAFLISECDEGFCDVRYHFFESKEEMGAEFVKLNSHLVTLKADDILRGMEGVIPALSRIRQECPFVGYDQIRRGASSPILSMAVLTRAWMGSANETPGSGGSGSALDRARSLTVDDATQCAEFLKLAYTAWGRDAEYVRLWGALNMTLCMWLYRRVVREKFSHKVQQVSPQAFGKCLMNLSADGAYVDWLVGRVMSDRDRAPAYSRIRKIFIARLQLEGVARPTMPAPAWSTHIYR